MVASHVSETLTIRSHKGPYPVYFDDQAFVKLRAPQPNRHHFIVDATIARLYTRDLEGVLGAGSVLVVEATEANKALDKFQGYIEHLVARSMRRGHTLVAIGGGIVQDIACFLGATLFRGVEWSFYPTTLLAQADSCIGSKSSVNVGSLKNLVGTFTPPSHVIVDTTVLETLESKDIRSGIGEMLKVHAIDGPASFARIAADYERVLEDRGVMCEYIHRSLEIKKRLIEEDEFDQGIRRVLNYGHSFGHAIESATSFAVPHGIAVAMGMDLANYVSVSLGLTGAETFTRMHPVLAANCAGFEHSDVPLDVFLSAIAKDKKNSDDELTLVLPGAEGHISLVRCRNDERFREICAEYLQGGALAGNVVPARTSFTSAVAPIGSAAP